MRWRCSGASSLEELFAMTGIRDLIEGMGAPLELAVGQHLGAEVWELNGVLIDGIGEEPEIGTWGFYFKPEVEEQYSFYYSGLVGNIEFHYPEI